MLWVQTTETNQEQPHTHIATSCSGFKNTTNNANSKIKSYVTNNDSISYRKLYSGLAELAG